MRPRKIGIVGITAFAALTVVGTAASASDYPPDETTPTTVADYPPAETTPTTVAAVPAAGVTPSTVSTPVEIDPATTVVGSLPETGSDSAATIKIASGAAAAGVGLVLVGRRRRAARS